MKIFLIGDVVGRPGRRTVKTMLPSFIEKEDIDFVVANGENLAGGAGVTAEKAEEMFEAGVHVLTSGNHIWDKREALEYIQQEPRLLRPLNYPTSQPGQGFWIGSTDRAVKIGVISLIGRVFMPPYGDNPFRAVTEAVQKLRQQTSVIVVDFHGEATSEKLAMGWHLDGSVSAVVGTHTHVQTADDRVLPRGTAYITDLGMTGPYNSIIGIRIDSAMPRYIDALPTRFQTARGGERLCGVIVDVDEKSGRAHSIRRISLPLDPLDEKAIC